MLRCRMCGSWSGELATCLVCEALLELSESVEMSTERFLDLVDRAGREAGPALLDSAFDDDLLDDRTLAAVIGDVWSGASRPEDQLPWATWTAMFTRVGYIEDGRPVDRPTGDLVLYRAASDKHRFRHSWTDRLEVAEQFLTFGDRPRWSPSVWTATVPSSQLLARITHIRRGESEYVLETKGLRIEKAA